MSFLLFLYPNCLRAADKYWTNISGGDWNDGGSWSPDQIAPTGQDSAYIVADGNYIVSVTNGVQVSRLILGGAIGTQTLLISAGYLSVSTDSTIGTNGVLQIEGRTELRQQGPLSIAGTLISTNGSNTLAGFGPVTVEATGQILAHDFNLSPNQASATPRSWVNHGQFLWLGGHLKAPGNVRFENRASGLLEIGDGLEGDGGSGRTLFIANEGLIRKAVGTNLVMLGRAGTLVVSNLGSIEISSGGLNFTNTNDRFRQVGGVTTLAGGTLASANPVIVEGGLFQGFGTVDAQLSHSKGSLRPGYPDGTLKVVGGPYILSAEAALNVMIGGADAGSEYSQIEVAGTATLNGMVNVCMANGFTPPVGSAFEIIKCNSRSGSPLFSGLCARGVDFNPELSTTGMTLWAISAPIVDSPFLKRFLEGQDHVLCWPTGYGVTLETTPELNPPMWTKVPVVESNSYSFRPTDPSRFFRLFSE